MFDLLSLRLYCSFFSSTQTSIDGLTVLRGNVDHVYLCGILNTIHSASPSMKKKICPSLIAFIREKKRLLFLSAFALSFCFCLLLQSQRHSPVNCSTLNSWYHYLATWGTVTRCWRHSTWHREPPQYFNSFLYVLRKQKLLNKYCRCLAKSSSRNFFSIILILS